MDRDVFVNALSGLPNSEELVKFFEDSINAERTKGISSSHKANSDNARLKKALSKLGWDGTVDFDSFVDSVSDTLNGTKVSGNAELSELQSQVRKLQKAFDTAQTELKGEREQREQLQKINKVKTIESKVLPRLSNDINGANWIVKSLLSEGALDLDDNGEIVVRNGEDTLGFEDGIKHIISTNPDLRKSKQVSGVGSSSASQSTGGSMVKPKYTLEQLKSMTQEEAVQDLAGYNESMKFHNSK